MKEYLAYEYSDINSWEDIKLIIEKFKENKPVWLVIQKDIENFEKIYETLKFNSEVENNMEKYLMDRVLLDEGLVIHAYWFGIDNGDIQMEMNFSEGEYEIRYSGYKGFDINGKCETESEDDISEFGIESVESSENCKNSSVWEWIVGIFNGKV